jgi:OsmC-like protein
MGNASPSFEAQVRLAPGEGEPVVPTNHIVFRHHRAPEVAWSIDVATGGHVLHLALAQCVFNNVLRIAQERELALSDVRVTADGGFDEDGTASTGIDCAIELSGAADRSNLTGLAREAFDASSVVAVLRRGGSVELTSVRATGKPNLGSATH